MCYRTPYALLSRCARPRVCRLSHFLGHLLSRVVLDVLLLVKVGRNLLREKHSDQGERVRGTG